MNNETKERFDKLSLSEKIEDLSEKMLDNAERFDTIVDLVDEVSRRNLMAYRSRHMELINDFQAFLHSNEPESLEEPTTVYRGPFRFERLIEQVLYLETDDNVERGEVRIEYNPHSMQFVIYHDYDWVEETPSAQWVSQRLDIWRQRPTDMPQFLHDYFIATDIPDQVLNALRALERRGKEARTK